MENVKKITIYDVAKASGCSSATVSLVLKKDSRVKNETKEKVLRVMKELKYKPNYLARGLAKQRTNTLGLIIPDLKNPVFSDIIGGVEEYINQKDYHLIVGVTNLNKNKEMFYLNMLRENRVDGLIILPTFIEDIKKELIRFKSENFPFVLSGVSIRDTNVNYVSCNMEDGAYLAVSHLIEQGHKNIAFIAGAADTSQIKERLMGYKCAFEKYGIKYNEDYIIECGPTLEDSYNATIKLVNNNREVTGIFCICDYIAVGAVKAIIDAGYKIPDDYGVAGYDNIDVSGYLPVSLTTVETNNKKVGMYAAKILIQQIEDPQCDFQHIILHPKLIVRKSTERLPKT